MSSTLCFRVCSGLEEIDVAIMELEVRKVREQMAVKEDPAAAVTYGALFKPGRSKVPRVGKQRIIAEKAVNAGA